MINRNKFTTVGSFKDFTEKGKNTDLYSPLLVNYTERVKDEIINQLKVDKKLSDNDAEEFLDNMFSLGEERTSQIKTDIKNSNAKDESVEDCAKNIIDKYYKITRVNKYEEPMQHEEITEVSESLLDKISGPSEDEIWKKLGYNKSFNTPEDFFLDVIDGIKVKVFENKPNSVFYMKDGKIIFEFNKLRETWLYIDYELVWKILIKIFDMKNIDGYDFLYKMINKYLNIDGLKERNMSYCHFNKKINNIKESLLNKIEGPTEEEIMQSFRYIPVHEILFKSIGMNFKKGIEFALKEGAKINYTVSINYYMDDNDKKITDFFGDCNAVILAVKLKNFELADYLISLGGDLEACKRRALGDAIFNNQLDIVKYCISKGMVVNRNLIERGVKNGSVKVIEYLQNNNLIKESLLDKIEGVNEEDLFYKLINSYGDEQYKLLKGLLKQGEINIFKELFDNNISISNENGEQLIFDAIDYDQFDILDILLKNGFIPNNETIFYASSVLGSDDVITMKLRRYKEESNSIKENVYYHYKDVPVSLFWNFIRMSNDLKTKFEFNTSLINEYKNSLNNPDYIFYVQTDEIEKEDVEFEFSNSVVLGKFAKYLTDEDITHIRLFFGINKEHKLRFGYLVGLKRYVIGNIDYRSVDLKKLSNNMKYISNDMSIIEISKKFKSSLTIINNLKGMLDTYLQHYPDVKVYVDIVNNNFCLNIQTDDEDILNSIYLNNILKSNKVYKLNIEFNLEEIKKGKHYIYQITIKNNRIL